VVSGQALGRLLLPRKNPWPVVIDRKDIVYFDVFRTRIVYDLSGYSCSDFWSRIVLCEGMTEESVLESILAVGALSTAITLASQLRGPHKLSKLPSALRPWTSDIMANEHHKAAVCHYLKALSLFRSRVKSGTTMLSSRLIFIMSMLFITFEMLQGNMQTVDSLITSSIGLLENTLQLHRQDRLSGHGIQSTARSKEDDMEDIEHLLPLVSIMGGYTPFLASQSANFCLWDISIGHDLPLAGHPSIAKVQTQWSKFCARAAAFVGRGSALHAPTTTPQPTAGEQQRVLITQLSIWRSELDSWLADEKLSETARRALHIMQIQHLMLWVCVSACLDDTQLAFDAFEADFQTLLRRCAMFLREARPTYLFTLNTSIVSALSVIITKCRVHNIRMMAAELLCRIPWREGAWDATLMVHGKSGTVLLEERARDGSGFIAPKNRWAWTGSEWDIGRGVLVVKCTRAVPDEMGTPVEANLELDLERYPDVCFDIGCSVDHAADCARLDAVGTFY
jgi:hypothetical protein